MRACTAEFGPRPTHVSIRPGRLQSQYSILYASVLLSDLVHVVSCAVASYRDSTFLGNHQIT